MRAGDDEQMINYEWPYPVYYCLPPNPHCSHNLTQLLKYIE